MQRKHKIRVAAAAAVAAVAAGTAYLTTTGTSGWSGDFAGGKTSAYQGVQDTPHMGAASVGGHTKITVGPYPGCPAAYCADEHVWADSTGNHASKSRAELVTSAASTGATSGATKTYRAHVLINGAPSNQQICVWRNVWQFATGFQFQGPRLELISRNGQIHWGVTMWTGTAAGARGMAGVNPADLGPVVYNVFHDISETVKWSPTANGSVTVKIDGATVFTRTNVQTMPSDLIKQYWKIGPYQHDGCDGRQVVALPSVS